MVSLVFKNKSKTLRIFLKTIQINNIKYDIILLFSSQSNADIYIYIYIKSSNMISFKLDVFFFYLFNFKSYYT